MKPIPRALGGADIADGGAVENALGHLVHQGFGVFEANQAAKLLGVDPVALGLFRRQGGDEFVQLLLDVVEPKQDVVHAGLTGSG